MKFKNPFDKIDIIMIIGLLMLGGGIYSQIPWLAFCVIGAILSVIGLLAAIKSEKK